MHWCWEGLVVGESKVRYKSLINGRLGTKIQQSTARVWFVVRVAKWVCHKH
jgi:hypothetical protein